MEFSIKGASPEKQRNAAVVVGVFESRKLTGPAQAIDHASDGYLTEILRCGDMEGRLGTTLVLHKVPHTAAERVLLVGLGKEREFRDKEYRDAVRAAVRGLNETGAVDAALNFTDLPIKKRGTSWRVAQAAVVALESMYRFDRLKSKQEGPKRALRKLVFAVAQRSETAAAEEGLRRGLATAHGMSLAKDLGNLPANVCTPTYLAEQAQDLAKHYGFDMHRARAGGHGGARHGCSPLCDAGQRPAAEADRAPPSRREGARPARGTGRQGHHLRHRRHLPEARPPRWTR